MMRIANDAYWASDVARVLNCSVSHVKNLFNTGRLKAYRMPPTGPLAGERRVTRKVLSAFLEAHGFPPLESTGEQPDARRP